jgi:hypothetical protein
MCCTSHLCIHRSQKSWILYNYEDIQLEISSIGTRTGILQFQNTFSFWGCKRQTRHLIKAIGVLHEKVRRQCKRKPKSANPPYAETRSLDKFWRGTSGGDRKEVTKPTNRDFFCILESDFCN